MYNNIVNRYKCPYTIPDIHNDINIRRNPFITYKNDNEESLHGNISFLGNSNHFEKKLIYKDDMSSIESLTNSVKQCKQQILNVVDDLENKNKLIERLVELNERLHLVKEAENNYVRKESFESDMSFDSDHSINIAGHSLVLIRQGIGLIRYCEACCRTVVAGMRVYRCEQCIIFLHCNWSCTKNLYRICPATNFNSATALSLPSSLRNKSSTKNNNVYVNIDSYPLTANLTSQSFLCAECFCPVKAVSNTDRYSSNRSQTKFCSYYRKFYCFNCHWGNKHFIPAVYFTINKWKKMSVCRNAYIYLTYAWDKALFRMPLFWEQNNAQVDDVLTIRKKLFAMRSFVYACNSMKKVVEGSPDWFIDQPYLVTMQFVEDICAGRALEMVQVIYSAIVAHIPQCETCKGLCNSCHVCNSAEILYVMSTAVWTCSLCFVTCIHEQCGLLEYKHKSDYQCQNCSKL